MSSFASVASKSTAAPLRPRGVASRHRHGRSSPKIVRAGSSSASKTAVSKHDVPPKWSTDTCLRKNQRVSLKEGEKLTISVPATSANMGPGFDSFGFAVDLENELIVERGPFKVDIRGEGESSLPRDETNAIIGAVKDGYNAVYPECPLEVDDLQFTSINRIPPARGLGSSSAALVSGLAAGLALAGQDLSAPQTKQLLLQLAADAEGHPDNVAPAIYGGFQVSINTGGAHPQWVTQRIALPEGMQAILFIPEFESLTAETRAALPTEIPVADAVFNISRAAMLVNSFATGNMEALRYACQDVIHQPVRGEAFPLKELMNAALSKGAHGAFLSGAGPTVLALTGGHGSDVDADTMVTFLAVEVADAMLDAAIEHGCEGRVVISSPSEAGVVCEKEKPARYIPQTFYADERV